MSDPLIRAEGLTKRYPVDESLAGRLRGGGDEVRALDGVDLTVRAGEVVAVVGESGCGKTTLGRTLLHLDEPTAGTVAHRGTDLASLSEADLRDRRGDLGWLSQDAAASLDPRRRVGDAVAAALERHADLDERRRRARVADLFESVGLSPDLTARFPRELSGGQRQRVALARALAPDPEFVVLDEPTSSLDVNEQARVANLVADRADDGVGVLLVAHDLPLAAHLADRVVVLYLGAVVESGPTDRVLSPPYHPYTRALLAASPEPDPAWSAPAFRLRGDPPSPVDPPGGCRFHTRCPVAREECAEWDDDPELELVDQESTLETVDDDLTPEAVDDVGGRVVGDGHRLACPFAVEDEWDRDEGDDRRTNRA